MMKYTLQSECFPVSGKMRGVIYDLGRTGYDLIPVDLAYFLKENRQFYANQLKGKDEESFGNYLTFLLENEYIFPVEENEMDLFIPNEIVWEVPHHITNTYLTLGEKNIAHFPKILKCIEKVLCPHLFIEINHIDKDQFPTTLLHLNDKGFKSCSLAIDYTLLGSIDESFFKKVFEIPCIAEVFIYNYEGKKGIDYYGSRGFYKKLIKSTASMDARRNAEQLRSSFMVNRSLFYESKNYNNYYYKKLFISKNGEIQNQKDTEAFGNIADEDILNRIVPIVNSKSFTAIGKVKKDQIQVCKDCEFRYMCVDDRTPELTAIDNEYKHDSTCAYDPYSCSWES